MKYTTDYTWYASYVDTDMLWLEDSLNWDNAFELVASEYSLFESLTVAFFVTTHHFIDWFVKLSVLDVTSIWGTSSSQELTELFLNWVRDFSTAFSNSAFATPFLFYTDYQDWVTISMYYSPELVLPIQEFITSIFDHYGQVKVGEVQSRTNGVLISNVKGKTLAYALFNLQGRGRLMTDANMEVYEGQVVGIHSRGNDLTVNPTKAKQLTNVRASGTDEATVLSPPIRYTLEQALEFIEDDELVEVTPISIRVRKKFLLEHERKRAARPAKA